MATARKRGDSWRVQVYIGRDEYGKRKYSSVTASTKKEAERLAASVRINNHLKEDFTFIEASKHYIESRRNTLSPSTISGYEKIVRNHIGKIKNIRLSRITNDDIQRQLDDLAAGHSPKTVENARAFISSVLKNFAPELQLRLATPAKEKKERRIPSDDELQRILKSATDDFMRIAIELAAFGGLRESEVSGLYPDCVHEDCISIRRVMVETSGGNVLKETPKSFAGFRDVPIPIRLLGQLQQIDRSADQPLIPYTPKQIRSRFETIRKKADCENISFHSLRHYFATYCHAQGLPDKSIARIGGWENVSTLQKIYEHSTRQREDDLASIINAHFEKMQP